MSESDTKKNDVVAPTTKTTLKLNGGAKPFIPSTNAAAVTNPDKAANLGHTTQGNSNHQIGMNMQYGAPNMMAQMPMQPYIMPAPMGNSMYLGQDGVGMSAQQQQNSYLMYQQMIQQQAHLAAAMGMQMPVAVMPPMGGPPPNSLVPGGVMNIPGDDVSTTAQLSHTSQANYCMGAEQVVTESSEATPNVSSSSDSTTAEAAKKGKKKDKKQVAVQSITDPSATTTGPCVVVTDTNNSVDDGVVTAEHNTTGDSKLADTVIAVDSNNEKREKICIDLSTDAANDTSPNVVQLGQSKCVYSKSELLDLYSADVDYTSAVSTTFSPEVAAVQKSYLLDSGGTAGKSNAPRAPFGFIMESVRGQHLVDEGYFIAHTPMSSGRHHNSSSGMNSGSNNIRRRGDPIDRSGSTSPQPDQHHFNNSYHGDRQHHRRHNDNHSHYHARDGGDKGSEVKEYKSIFAQVDPNDPETVARKANTLLNKMSVTKFDKLSGDFLSLLRESCVGINIDSDSITTGNAPANAIPEKAEEKLRLAVSALVAKAQMEENFCFLYADLCRKVIDQWLDLEPTGNVFANVAGGRPEEDADGTAAEQRPMGRVFKEFLLIRCQHEFEFDRVAALEVIRADVELADDERVEQEILLKKRFTGHMRFIGEIYMKDLVKANIMKESCLDVLLSSLEEEELVCLCKLFQTIGAKLEAYYADKARLKKNKAKGMGEIFSQYFVRLKELSDSHPSSRVRFMLRDLIEMRDNGWTARREEEKMVNLDMSRGVAASNTVSSHHDSNNKPHVMASTPQDEWEVVTSTGKKGKSASSANLVGQGTNGGSSFGGSSGMTRNANSFSGNIQRGGSFNNLSSQDGRRGIDRMTKDKDRYNNNAGINSSSRRGGSSSIVQPSFTKSNSGRNNFGGRDDGRNSPKPPSSNSNNGRGGGKDYSKPSAAATPAPLTATTDDLQLCAKRLKSAMDEYCETGMLEEITLTYQELNPLQSLLPDIVKGLILRVLEKKNDSDRTALCIFLEELHRTIKVGNGPALTLNDLSTGIDKFLDQLDDIIIDIPKAAVYGAQVLAELCLRGLFPLSSLGSLSEDNLFSTSPKLAEFIVMILSQIQEIVGNRENAASGEGATKAEELYRDANISLDKLVLAPPKETVDDVLNQLSTKHGVSFIAPGVSCAATSQH